MERREEKRMNSLRRLFTCNPQDPESRKDRIINGFRVEESPPWLLGVLLALQHVLVQSSVLVLVLGGVLEEREMERVLGPVLFSSGLSTLLQSSLGTRLPLVQAPSLEYMIPALTLLSLQSESGRSCRGRCDESWESVTQTDSMRELQGMVVTAGLLQFALGLSGLGGAVLAHSAPLVLAPVLCMLGVSIHREAALLCSIHWAFAALTVVVLVFLSQHLRSWVVPSCRRLPGYPVCRMLSVLLSMLLVWGVCSCVRYWGHVYSDSLSELRPEITTVNRSIVLIWQRPNASAHPNTSLPLPWFRFPVSGSGLPLLSGPAVAAGVAAALSVSISSLSVYMLSARLLGTPVAPAAACKRGLCVEGLCSVLAGLSGAPLGLCSSVANACSLGLTQCGCRSAVQAAGGMLLTVGMCPRLAHLLTSVPLAIHGAVLTVTYTVAVATGITYCQYTYVDSGRNIFNIGFTMFMALVLPQWFRVQAGFISTGIPSFDIILQSFLNLPIFIVGVLAFFLEHTVSGTLAERGLERDERTTQIWSLADKQQAQNQDHHQESVYNLPSFVRRLLSMLRARCARGCAWRTPNRQETTSTPLPEMSTLLSV